MRHRIDDTLKLAIAPCLGVKTCPFNDRVKELRMTGGREVRPRLLCLHL